MDSIEKYKIKGRQREAKYKIRFTNTAIDNFKVKDQLDKGKFIKVRFKDQRGIYLYWSPKTLTKKFYLRLKFNGRDYDLDLGTYLKGTYGCDEVLSKLSDIYKKYKEKGKWKSNPKEEILTKSELMDSQKLTIRQVIEKLCEYNFPRKDVEGRLASTTARQHSLFLLGHNKRINHLDFLDDINGMCAIQFRKDRLNREGKLVWDSRGVKSWEELWAQYPSGRGINKKGWNNPSNELSLYDNKISTAIIDDLTPGVVERYLEEKTRTYGYKKNILNALQCLWGFAQNNLRCFGDKRPLDPTSNIKLKRPIANKFVGSKHNHTVLDNDQIERLLDIIEEEKPNKPFNVLLIELYLNADIRIEEGKKLLKEDFKSDHILLRKEIQKNRSKGIKVKDKIIPITPFIQTIVDDLKQYYKKFPQYNFVPWAFPSSRINLTKLSEPGYAQSIACRVKDVSETFVIIREKLGVDCSLKTLRKTYITQTVEAERDLGKTTEEAIKTVSDSTHPENPQTIKTHYYKPTVKNQIKRAKQLSKVIQIKRDS